MSDQFKDIEPMVCKSKINIPYHWWAGDTASKFLIALRDNEKITATSCKKCDKVFLPPRKVCPICFNEKIEWVDVSNEGVVESFTIVRRQLASLEKKVPVIFALIKLDGSDTSLLHNLDEVKPEDVKIGMKVNAVFSKEKIGSIKDIAYFKPND